MINEENLNSNWNFIQIKDACELVMGQSPPGSSYNEKRKGMPFLQGKAEFGKTYPHNVKYTTDPKRTTKKGNILMSVRAPVGDVNIANIDYCIGRGLASLNLKNGDNKYLFYLLNYIKPKIEQSGTGSTFKAITKSGLEKIKIPVPTLETQKKIVEILEKAEKLKEWRSKSDELADEYLKSVFDEMFGDPYKNPKEWKTVKLGNLSTKITDGVHAKPNYTEEGVPFISVVNCNSQYLKFENCKFISKEDHTKYFKRCNPEINDILYTKVGATYGIASIVDTNREFSLYVSVALIKPKHDKINSVFLKYLMNSKGIKHQANGSIRGIGVPDLHLIEIKKFKIILPPMELQEKFAEIVKQHEKLKNYQTQSKKEIDNLFNTLMQKAFKGELVC